MNEWLNVIFRWTHLAAGVMWIGHLWFFNFVNAQVAKTYDPDSRKKVLPELMPRAASASSSSSSVSSSTTSSGNP